MARFIGSNFLWSLMILTWFLDFAGFAVLLAGDYKLVVTW
jgi:hypothetical protein